MRGLFFCVALFLSSWSICQSDYKFGGAIRYEVGLNKANWNLIEPIFLFKYKKHQFEIGPQLLLQSRYFTPYHRDFGAAFSYVYYPLDLDNRFNLFFFFSPDYFIELSRVNFKKYARRYCDIDFGYGFTINITNRFYLNLRTAIGMSFDSYTEGVDDYNFSESKLFSSPDINFSASTCFGIRFKK
jgi:hypothetical protein